jgi:KipI family sensor histidine kinase inhibitor
MKPRIHACGEGALLLDVSHGAFDLVVQKRLWSATAAGGTLRRVAGAQDVVLGVNNVLVTFDPLRVEPEQLAQGVQQAWEQAEPGDEAGRALEVPVVYDRASGSELEGLARHAGLSVDEVIRLHTASDYHVACIGAVPGFVYLVGLAPALAMPRHSTPQARVPKGSVVIGGAQTGIIPMDMPSGWRALGMTRLDMFDPLRAEPCLLRPSDRVRFTAAKALPR